MKPSDGPADGTGLQAAFRQALTGGTAALGWTVLAAQIYSFVIYFIAGRPFRPWSFVKIGWLFLLMFSRVGLRVKLSGLFGYLLLPGHQGGEVSVTVHIAFLSGTALACWLLFRAGRRAGLMCGEDPVAKVLIGAAVALPYAAIVFLGSFLAIVRFPDRSVLMVDAVRWEALVFPLVMGGAAGGLGALLSEASRGGLARSAIGGWRAFVTAMVLSLVGLLVLGAIYPGGTSAYAGWLSNHGHVGPLAFAFQLLGLPNHASFILAPAMGGCDSLTAGNHAIKLLCAGTYAGPHLTSFLVLIGSTGQQGVVASGAATPWPFWLFLAVPLISTLAGGRWAARRVMDWPSRALRGTGAGLFFAALVVIASWASRVVIGEPLEAVLGPAPLITATLALVWGVLGGAVGGLSANWAQVGGSPVPDPGPPDSGAEVPAAGVVLGGEDGVEPPAPTSA